MMRLMRHLGCMHGHAMECKGWRVASAALLGQGMATSSPSGLSRRNLTLLANLAEDTALQVCLDQPFLPPCREFLPSLADTVYVLPSRVKLAPLIRLATLLAGPGFG